MYPNGPFYPHQSAPGPQPGPTHIYYTRGPMFMRRGPRRLFWFALGGISAYWFIQAKERKREMIMSQGGEEKRAGHCMGWGHWGNHRLEMKEAQQKMEDQHRKFRERFNEFGAFNSDTIVDMADSSLDSVMNSVMALKAKLAEQRAAAHAAQATENSKNDPRLV